MSPSVTTISSTALLSLQQKEAVLNLWNNEYPAQLACRGMDDLNLYLENLDTPMHYFARTDGAVAGWAFSFTREQDIWFAVIVGSAYHGRKIGTALLRALMQNESVLNGWVTDHNKYVRFNGDPYKSPLAFYQKNGFEVLHDIRLEMPKLSAVKIQWRRP